MIREFVPEDLRYLEEFAPRAFARYARFGHDSSLPEDGTRRYYEEEMQWYADRFDAGEEGFHLLVAEEEGRVIGYIALQTMPLPTSAYGFPWGEIRSLAVDPDCQGHGTGSALVEAGMEWFRDQDVRRVEVFTDLNNLGAIRAYEKSGFRIVHAGVTLSVDLSVT